MLINKFMVGYLSTNCYLVVCNETSTAIVIDPGFRENEAEKVLGEITSRNLEVKYIINTHGHIDHISGNGLLKQTTDAKIIIHENDSLMLTDHQKNLSSVLGLKVVSPQADVLIHGGEIIKFGKPEIKIIHTPGHTRGSISLYSKIDDVVFTGDTMFAGSIGRVDLPESSFEDINFSLKRLMQLPDQTIVYPGHGCKTTIAKERTKNPFVPR